MKTLGPEEQARSCPLTYLRQNRESFPMEKTSEPQPQIFISETHLKNYEAQERGV